MYTPPGNRARAAAYRQVDVSSQVLSASPHRLIELLYTELRSCLSGAEAAIVQGDTPAKLRLIGKAMRLIDEGLMAGLDMRHGGEIAANLNRIYAFCLLRLAEANVHNDRAIVHTVREILEPVMSGWSEIGKK